MKINFFGIVLVLITACSNPKEEKPLEKLAHNAPQAEVTSSNKLLKRIIGDGGELIRGVKFGDDLAQIRANEKLSFFEEEADYIAFTFDTRNMETVDILYFKDENNQLNGLQLDIYLNTKESMSELLLAFTEYYSAKYGQATTDIGTPTWKIPGGEVKIKTVINKLDHGLQVNYAKN